MSEQYISNRQLAFILFIYIASYPSVSIAKTVASLAGTGGWMLILISGMIVSIPFALYTYLGWVHKEKTLVEYSNLLVGKFVTYIFIFIIISSFFIPLFAVSRDAGELIKINLLRETPVSVISLTIFLVVYYLIIKGIKNIARVMEFYGLIFLILIILSYIILLTQGNLINLKPIFLSDATSHLKDIWYFLLPFGGYELIGAIPFRRNTTKKVFYYTLGTSIFITLFYIFITESNFSVIGVDEVVNYKDPGIIAIRRVELPFLQFLRRMDGFVVAAWIIGAFGTITVCSYIVIFYISKIFKKANYNIIAAIVLISGYIVSLLPKTGVQSNELFNMLYPYSGIASGFLVPIILVIVSKVKKYKTEE